MKQEIDKDVVECNWLYPEKWEQKKMCEIMYRCGSSYGFKGIKGWGRILSAMSAGFNYISYL